MRNQCKSFKARVKALGEYTLDFSEVMRGQALPCWYVGRGRVAGNTSPIPSGLHHSPREAWRAAYFAVIDMALAKAGAR